jgi:hypothetical protein
MNPAILDRRPLLPSILKIYQPIEGYWESFAPAPARDLPVEQALDPFDALLVSLALDMVPGFPVLVDLAAESTAGASSVLGLTHSHVRNVVTVASRASTAAARAVSALRGYVSTRGQRQGQAQGLAPFDVVPIEELSATLSDRSRSSVIILADARESDPVELVNLIGRWLEELPEVLVLLLGLGRVGESRVFGPLLGLCSEDSGKRFTLFRELGEVLAASNLALVARDDHPYAGDILLRIRGLYVGNFSFLNLLQSVNHTAMQEARVDDEVARTHPFWEPMRVEIETLKQEIQVANADRTRLWEMVEELPERIARTPVRTFLRRKLARGIIGTLYRASKRSARKIVSRIGV